MIHSIFILSISGEVIIEKHWKTLTPRSVCDTFCALVHRYENRMDVPPLIHTNQYYLINVLRDDIFVVAVLKQECLPLMIIEFLHRILNVCHEYFGSVQENVIKDNFSTVYQLLEEMLDNGYPLTTEPNALKEMIAPPTTAGRIAAMVSGKSSVSNVLPDGTISSIPWRKTGVKYSQNEIYFDIVEEIDAILDNRGQMVSFEVSGTINCKCQLSGTPDVTLVFVDPSVIDDCSFHPCVRYSRYEKERVISFVPPDGNFELMQYRVQVQRMVPPIYCQPTITYDRNNGMGILDVVVGTRTMPTLAANSKKNVIIPEEISVDIPFSKAVRTVEVHPEGGSALFDEALKTVRWNIGKFSKKNPNPHLKGKIILQPNTNTPDAKPALQLHFKVPSSTVSGLSVETLMITNEKYKPYKGVRTMTKSGKFQIRT